MTIWQYAQLAVVYQGSPLPGNTPTISWHGPGEDLRGDLAGDAGHGVVAALNAAGGLGWELTGQHQQQAHGDSSGYWDPDQTLITYTFKRPTPGQPELRSST